MKKIFEILFIFSIGVLLFTSCEQEINEYDLIDLGAAATTPGAATVEAVGETSCTIIITPNEIDVRTYYVVLNDSEETPDQYAVINASADVVASGYFVATVIENDTITVSGLDMEMVYDIYTFAVSETGVASAYSSAASVTTFDATGPSITAYSPAGGSVVYDMNQNIVLTFSEDITYDATKEITLFADYASYSEVISEENIVVDVLSRYG